MNTSNMNHSFMNSVYGNEMSIVNAEYRRSRDCFLENAFLFLDNAERIMSDARMANARVSVSNGLAYTGAFPTANLGTYIDWWQNSGLKEILYDQEGRKALTWCISGSPLTGMNSCMCVYPNGTTASIIHGNFSKIRRSLAEAGERNRYDGEMTDRFTIEEVAEILKTKAITEEEILRARLSVEQRANLRLRHGLNQVFAKYQDMCTRYEEICLKYHKDELSAFRIELLRLTCETEKELQAMSEIVRESRKAFREGRKSKEEHNLLMTEINKRRNELNGQLKKFKDDNIARLTADDELTEELIEYYLHK